MEILITVIILILYLWRRSYNNKKQNKFLKGQWELNNKNKK